VQARNARRRQNVLEETLTMFRNSAKSSLVYVLLLTAGLAGCSWFTQNPRAGSWSTGVLPNPVSSLAR